jgi:hypothetical protein
MSFDVATIELFDRQAKRLIKKYPSIRQELASLIAELRQSPEMGTALGNGFFKIRLAIASKGKGKSGGARVITFVKVTATTVYLASIFDKSDKSTITTKELDLIFKQIP